jgi:hypothetical protein
MKNKLEALEAEYKSIVIPNEDLCKSKKKLEAERLAIDE